MLKLEVRNIEFFEININNKNDKFKFFSRNSKVMLDISRVVQGLYEDYLKIKCSFQL
jgi:hypothetical protein